MKRSASSCNPNLGSGRRLKKMKASSTVSALLDEETLASPPPTTSTTPPNQEPPSTEPAAPKKFTDQQLENQSTVFIDNFAPNCFGWLCHFAKRAHYKFLKVHNTFMYLTKNSSVALFDFPVEQRDEAGREVARWCNMFKTGGERVINPFWLNNDPLTLGGTVFLRLSATPSYYMKKFGATKSELVTKAELPVAKAFAGGVLVVIKGVKVSDDGSTIAPMVVIEQVQHVQQQDPLANLNKKFDHCLLDEQEQLYDEDEMLKYLD